MAIIKKYSFFIEKELPTISLDNSQHYYYDFEMKPRIYKPKTIKNTNLVVLKVKAYNSFYYFYSTRISKVSIQLFANMKVWRIFIQN